MPLGREKRATMSTDWRWWLVWACGLFFAFILGIAAEREMWARHVKRERSKSNKRLRASLESASLQNKPDSREEPPSGPGGEA